MMSPVQAHPGSSPAEPPGFSSGASYFGQSKFFCLAVFVFLLGLGLSLRLLDLTDEPLDFHPARQLRTAIIARGFYYQMLPSADPVVEANAVSLMKSLEDYELPIFERIISLTYLAAGGEFLWIARIYSSLFWVLGGVLVFLLARRMTSVDGAVIAMGYYLLLPFAVIGGRSIQPESFMVFGILLSTYAFYRWSEDPGWKWTLITGLVSGLAVLVKPIAGFILVGVAVASVLSALGLRKAVKDARVYVLAGIMLAIPGVYYLLIAGSRSSGFLQFWTISFLQLLKEPWFYIRWLTLIHNLIKINVFVALLGVLLLPKRARATVLGLWAGYGLLGGMFAYQIHTHDYYSLPLVPIVALSLASMGDLLLGRLAQQARLWRIGFAVIALLGIAFVAWDIRTTLFVDDFRLERPGWRRVGESLPTDGPIIGITHEYGNRLRYYGWTGVAHWLYAADFNLFALQGRDPAADFDSYFHEVTGPYKYFLITLKGELEAQPLLKAMLYENYPVIMETDGSILFDLSQPLKPVDSQP